MMQDSAYPTDGEARERLAIARELATITARRGAVVGAITTAGVGILVAGALAAAYAFIPTHPIASIASFLVYGIALALLMWWHHRRGVVAARGFGRAYSNALVITMVLFGIGIATLRQNWAWPLQAAYCSLVALSMLIAGARMLIGVRR